MPEHESLLPSLGAARCLCCATRRAKGCASVYRQVSMPFMIKPRQRGACGARPRSWLSKKRVRGPKPDQETFANVEPRWSEYRHRANASAMKATCSPAKKETKEK